MILGPNLQNVVLVSHSSVGVMREGEGVWRDFSVFQGTNVVGKFVASYFNYVSRFCLKLGVPTKERTCEMSVQEKNIQDLL